MLRAASREDEEITALKGGTVLALERTYIGLTVVALMCGFAVAEGESKAKAETGRVRGRVVNLWGVPLAGAQLSFFKLEIWPEPGVSSPQKLVKEVTTDEEGQYIAEGLHWGLYNVNVTRREYCCADVLRLYLAKGGEQVLDVGVPLALQNGLDLITVRGKVYGERHQPISDASITLVNAHNSQRSDQKRTEGNGMYEFHLVQPGQYVIYASKPGFTVESEAVDLGSGDSQTIDIQLKASHAKGLNLK